MSEALELIKYPDTYSRMARNGKQRFYRYKAKKDISKTLVNYFTNVSLNASSVHYEDFNKRLDGEKACR